MQYILTEEEFTSLANKGSNEAIVRVEDFRSRVLILLAEVAQQYGVSTKVDPSYPLLEDLANRIKSLP